MRSIQMTCSIYTYTRHVKFVILPFGFAWECYYLAFGIDFGGFQGLIFFIDNLQILSWT